MIYAKKQLALVLSRHSGYSAQEDTDSVSDEIDNITGTQPSNIDYDCTLLECHVDLDLPGYEETGEDGEATGIKYLTLSPLVKIMVRCSLFVGTIVRKTNLNAKYNILYTTSFSQALVSTDLV